MRIYHKGLDVYDDVPERKAVTMLAAGWEYVDTAAPDTAAAADPSVEHPDDPAVESVRYTEAEMKKRNKPAKAGSTK